MRNHPGRRIQTETLGELFNEAYTKSASLENSTAGFCTAGIVPFNAEIIPNDQFIEDPRLPEAAPPTNEGSPLAGNSTTALHVADTSMTTTPQTPSTSRVSSCVTTPNVTPVTPPVGEQNDVSFENILSVPKLVVERKKRGETSQIITSSLYKRKLLEEKEASENKEPKKPKPPKSQPAKEKKAKGKKAEAKKPKAAKTMFGNFTVCVKCHSCRPLSSLVVKSCC